LGEGQEQGEQAERERTDTKPVVFIIDELDRCRPTFAIELLEKAKHFFNVKNVVFVIAADKKQMGHSIKAIYGQDLDVNGYLRRFIDFDYLLPIAEKGEYIKVLFDQFGFQEFFKKTKAVSNNYEYDHALKMLQELSDIFGLRLREQEHCCSLLSISIRTVWENEYLYPLLLSFLFVVKVKEPDIYKDIISGKLAGLEVINYLSGKKGAAELLSTNYGKALEIYIHRIA
jgi:hypothetical protein